MKLRALDLFCCAGGATRGLQMAGFHVTGIDIRPQPRYCGDAFIQADALKPPVDLRAFDFIWASPPCQEHSALRHLHPERVYACHIAAVRRMLNESGVPYCIENVPGAPLRRSLVLCGSSFGLRVRRHRIFEMGFLLRDWAPRCQHRKQGSPIDVSGTGAKRKTRRDDDHGGSCNKPANLAEARAAIGIDWMTRPEIAQAIPPAYSEWIARQFLAAAEMFQTEGPECCA